MMVSWKYGRGQSATRLKVRAESVCVDVEKNIVELAVVRASAIEAPANDILDLIMRAYLKVVNIILDL